MYVYAFSERIIYVYYSLIIVNPHDLPKVLYPDPMGKLCFHTLREMM